LLVRDEVVQNDLGMAASAPLSFVATDAMKEIQDGIFRVGRIARRSIDERLAFVADGFGIVFDHLKLALGDVVPRFVEPFRRSWKGRFVVRLQLDWSAKSA